MHYSVWLSQKITIELLLVTPCIHRSFGGKLSEKVFRPREAFRPVFNAQTVKKILLQAQQRPSTRSFFVFLFARFLWRLSVPLKESEISCDRVARSNGKANVQNDRGSMSVEIFDAYLRNGTRVLSPGCILGYGLRISIIR